MDAPRRNLAVVMTYGGPDDEHPELRKLVADVAANEDDFQAWEKLVSHAESLEGGLNRNSSPHAIDFVRKAYDNFLSKFPLFFGYWKKYGELEYHIAGPEASEMVYERAVASVSNSVDLWVAYCTHKMTTSHVTETIRELFERGAKCVGLEFMSHPFWDKYMEFEEQAAEHGLNGEPFGVLNQLIHIPLYQYSRYFQRFRDMAALRPVQELAPPEVLQQAQSELLADPNAATRTEVEKERLLRARLDQYHVTIYNKTTADVQKRWTYEQEIKRPYFHVTELEPSEPANWNKYLDFEEAEPNNYERIVFLYERCLVTCAQLPEFWLRYARWMSTQKDKEEEVRNIYQRASYIFVPIADPQIRLLWARFEEQTGRIDIARDIHLAILLDNPGHLETILSWANLERRHAGIDAAINALQDSIQQLNGISSDVQGALVAEQARLLYYIKRSPNEARQLFHVQQNAYLESGAFWSAYLRFEIDQPLATDESDADAHKRIEQVFKTMRSKTRLTRETTKALSRDYMQFLLERGDKSSIDEYLKIDTTINGPQSAQKNSPPSGKKPDQG